MSVNLDKSLDEIISSEPKRGRGGRGRGAGRGGRGGRRTGSNNNGSFNGSYSHPLSRTADEDEGGYSGPVRRGRGPRAAPYSTGGSRADDGQWQHDKYSEASRAQPQSSVVGNGRLEPSTKILLSNLDSDVTSADIRDIFASRVGEVIRAVVNYDEKGKSLGTAEVTFAEPKAAATAAKEYDKAEVNGRPMHVRLVTSVVEEVSRPVVQRRQPVVQQRQQPQYYEEAEEYYPRRPQRQFNNGGGQRGGQRRGGRGASRGGSGAGNGAGRRGRGGRGGAGAGGRDRTKQAEPKPEDLDAEMDAYQSARGASDAAPATAGQPKA